MLEFASCFDLNQSLRSFSLSSVWFSIQHHDWQLRIHNLESSNLIATSLTLMNLSISAFWLVCQTAVNNELFHLFSVYYMDLWFVICNFSIHFWTANTFSSISSQTNLHTQLNFEIAELYTTLTSQYWLQFFNRNNIIFFHATFVTKRTEGKMLCVKSKKDYLNSKFWANYSLAQ